MVIEYANTIDDLAEFTRFHLLKSAVGKRNRLIGFVSFSGTVFLLFSVTVFAVLRPSASFATAVVLAIAAVLAVVLGLMYAWVMAHQALRVARRIHAEGKNKGTIGWHRLSITDRTLREESEGGVFDSVFDAIERVEETSEYAFIYTAAAAGHVVPKNAVTSGDLDAFVSELKRRITEVDSSS